ncbi:hypothetical protein D3C80_1469680 [compost metagenome]
MIRLYLFQIREPIHQFSFKENRLLHGYGFIVLHRLLDIWMNRIKQTKLAAISSLLFLRETNVISDRLAILFADDPKHVLPSRRSYFFRIARYFDRRLHFSFTFALYHLVYSAQSRLVCRCNKLCPDTPNIDACTLSLQVKNGILVQIIRSHNLNVIQTSRIQHAAGLNR